MHTSKPEPLSCVPGISVAPSELHSVTVEQTLRDVQTSRSRLRFFILWLEQVIPNVTDSNYPDDDEYERHQPCLTLASSILTILREALPSDKPSSSSTPTVASTPCRSRVSVVEEELTQQFGSAGIGWGRTVYGDVGWRFRPRRVPELSKYLWRRGVAIDKDSFVVVFNFCLFASMRMFANVSKQQVTPMAARNFTTRTSNPFVKVLLDWQVTA